MYSDYEPDDEPVVFSMCSQCGDSCIDASPHDVDYFTQKGLPWGLHFLDEGTGERSLWCESCITDRQYREWLDGQNPPDAASVQVEIENGNEASKPELH